MERQFVVNVALILPVDYNARYPGPRPRFTALYVGGDRVNTLVC